MIVAGIVTPGATAVRGPVEQPPNVLIIMTDDQRVGTMAVMPESRRWFARRGVKFPQAFAPTPLCCPARASLFTGQYAHNHGVQRNADGPQMDQATTLQSNLQQAGYLTAIAGKYLNGWDVATPPPHFDRFAIPRLGEPDSRYYDSTFNVDGTVQSVPTYSTSFVRRRAVEFVSWFEAVDDAAPWFLVVTPYAPHAPATPARRYEDAPVPAWIPTPADLETDRSDKPPIVQQANQTLRRAKFFRRRQLRSLMSVDELVASVMSRLRDLGEGSNTLAFLMSDNGYLWADHGWQTGKRVPYLHSIRVPLLARLPGGLSAGTVDDRLVTIVDVAATVFDATEVEPAHPLDGRSLLDAWQRDHVLLEYWEDAGVPAWASIWRPELQYVEWYDEDAATVTFREYYDLEKDPWQLANLLGDDRRRNDPPAELLQELEDQLAEERRCVGTTGASACP